MLKKLIPIVLLPLIAFAQPAEARRLFWWETVNPDEPAPPPQPYRQAYGVPDDQSLYGAPSDEQFNERQYQLYQREMQRRYGRGYDVIPQDAPPPPRYAQPDPIVPYAAPVYPKPKPVVKKVVRAKPVKPAVVPTEKQVTQAPSSKSVGPVTCDKGLSIVSGYGFENVKTKTCETGTLAYNAERSGQPFEIDVNPKTGELIAVKKITVAKELSEQAQPNVKKLPVIKGTGQEI